MNREDWLINEVDKWQEDKIIDAEAGEKIKKQYEIYRNFNPNIFTILFAILGAILIVSGIGIVAFYNWRTLPKIAKLVIAVAPLVISYIISIFTVLFKTESKVWKESSAFLNTVSLFFALGIIVPVFHFEMTLSNYLIISSILTLPVIYIMQSASPLIIYYTAILFWGSLNISLMTAPILLLLFLLGAGVIAFSIKTFSKTFRYTACILAIAGLPFMILFTKMLNGDSVLAALLYSTILFAARDVKRSTMHFKLISVLVSILTIIYMTTSQAWTMFQGDFGGITLGILTALVLLGSLALEVFNPKENTYEFAYLLLLMGLSIIRYVWGCIHLESILLQMIFMGVGIIISLLTALGFVELGKQNKKINISTIGFVMLALTILIKIFESSLLFVWRGVAFLVIGSLFLVLVAVLLILNSKSEENNDTQPAQNAENQSENKETVETEDGGQSDEEDNIIS